MLPGPQLFLKFPQTQSLFYRHLHSQASSGGILGIIQEESRGGNGVSKKPHSVLGVLLWLESIKVHWVTCTAVAEAIPSSSGPGRPLEGGQISSYVSISQAGAELKVAIWDSPVGSRCLESIDFLLCTLDFPHVIGLHQANFKPVKTHYWRSQPWTKPCMWHFWKSGLVLCRHSLLPPPSSSLFHVSYLFSCPHLL